MSELVTKRGLVQGRGISVSVIKTENASIALCYDGERPHLGTLAAALPFGEEGKPISSILLGEKDALLCRAIAERITSLTGKISLLSVSLKQVPATDAGKEIFKLLSKIYAKGQ